MEENGNDAQKVMFISLVFLSFRMRFRKCVGYRAGSGSNTRTCHHVFISCNLNSTLLDTNRVFSNAIPRAGCPRARERQSQARVCYDDHGMVRPLQPRAKQHCDAATAQRGVQELDQQAAARRESDGEEVSGPCRLWSSAGEALVIYRTGHILRFTIVAYWNSGVVVGRGKIYFCHLLSL